MEFTEYSFKYKACLIDDEHELLLASLAKLRSASGLELEAGAAARVLTGFAARLCGHFDSEETLLANLDQIGFDYEWHCLAHNSLLEKIAGMHADIRAGKPFAPAQLADVLAGWLAEHDATYDSQMRDLLGVAEQEASPIPEIACRPLIAMSH